MKVSLTEAECASKFADHSALRWNGIRYRKWLSADLGIALNHSLWTVHKLTLNGFNLSEAVIFLGVRVTAIITVRG
jgi:hypothetical protein